MADNIFITILLIDNMKIVSRSEFNKNYINNYSPTQNSDQGQPLYEKTYQGSERVRIIIKAIFETLPIITLFSKNVREDWLAAFTGKKVIAIREENLSVKKKDSLIILQPKKNHELTIQTLKPAAKINPDQPIVPIENFNQHKEELPALQPLKPYIFDIDKAKEYYMAFIPKLNIGEGSEAHLKVLQDESFLNGMQEIENLSESELQVLQTACLEIKDNLLNMQAKKLNIIDEDRDLAKILKESLSFSNDFYSIRFLKVDTIEAWQVYLKEPLQQEKLSHKTLCYLALGYLLKEAPIKMAYPRRLDLIEFETAYPHIPVRQYRTTSEILNDTVIEVLF